MVKFFRSLIVSGLLFSSITVFLFYVFLFLTPDDPMFGGNCESYDHCKDDLILLPITVEEEPRTETL